MTHSNEFGISLPYVGAGSQSTIVDCAVDRRIGRAQGQRGTPDNQLKMLCIFLN